MLLTMDRCKSLEFWEVLNCVNGSIKHQSRRNTFQDVQPYHFWYRWKLLMYHYKEYLKNYWAFVFSSHNNQPPCSTKSPSTKRHKRNLTLVHSLASWLAVEAEMAVENNRLNRVNHPLAYTYCRLFYNIVSTSCLVVMTKESQVTLL